MPGALTVTLGPWMSHLIITLVNGQSVKDQEDKRSVISSLQAALMGMTEGGGSLFYVEGNETEEGSKSLLISAKVCY